MQCKAKDAYGQCSESVRMVRAIPAVSKKTRLDRAISNDMGGIFLYDVVPADDGLCEYCRKKKQGLFN